MRDRLLRAFSLNENTLFLQRLRAALANGRIDSKGSVAITFSLTMVAVIGAVGMAVDFSRANSVKAHMQSALDAALLSTVKEAVAGSLPDVSAAVQTAFTANLSQVDATNVQVTSQFDSATSTLAGQATGVVQAHFVSLLGHGTMGVTVRSKTRAVLAQGCVLSLSQAASSAVRFGGSSDVNLRNCTLFVNSKNSSALSLGGAAHLSAYYVGVVGGISGASKITATKGVETGTAAYTDPYAGLSVPSFSGCTQTSYSVPGGSY